MELSSFGEDASFTDEVATLIAEADQKVQTNQDAAVRGDVIQLDESTDFFKGETGASLVDQDEITVPKTQSYWPKSPLEK